MMIEHVDAIIDLRRYQTLEMAPRQARPPRHWANSRAADNPGGRDLADPPRLGQRSRLPLLSTITQHRRAALAGRRRLRSAQPAHPALAGQPAAPGRHRFCRAGRGGTRLRRSRPAAGRRSNLPGSGKTQHRHPVEVSLRAHRDRRSPCAALPEERIPGLRRPLSRCCITARCCLSCSIRAGCVAGDEARRQHHLSRSLLSRPLQWRVSRRRAACSIASASSGVEMERSRPALSCCGGGGGAPLSDIAGKRRIPDIRMDACTRNRCRARSRSPVPTARSCWKASSGQRPEVADIAELLEAAL